MAFYAEEVIARGRQVLMLIPEIALTTQIVARLQRRFQNTEVLHSRLTPRMRREALARIERFFSGTIHAFCARLLRERPIEACIDPMFEVLTEPKADRLFDEAFQGWLHLQLESPPDGLRRALRRSVKLSKEARGVSLHG